MIPSILSNLSIANLRFNTFGRSQNTLFSVKYSPSALHNIVLWTCLHFTACWLFKLHKIQYILMDWFSQWHNSHSVCPLPTGSVNWGLRCGRLSNGAGQCGSQDESSYSKHWTKVPRLHCQARWHVLLIIHHPTNQCQFTVYIPLMFLLFLSYFAVVDDWEDTTMFSFLDTRDKTAVVAKRMKYFTNSGKMLFAISCLTFPVNTI